MCTDTRHSCPPNRPDRKRKIPVVWTSGLSVAPGGRLDTEFNIRVSSGLASCAAIKKVYSRPMRRSDVAELLAITSPVSTCVTTSTGASSGTTSITRHLCVAAKPWLLTASMHSTWVPKSCAHGVQRSDMMAGSDSLWIPLPRTVDKCRPGGSVPTVKPT